MVSLFIAHVSETIASPEQLRTDLEAKGYTIRDQPPTSSQQSPLYQRTIEQAIMSSADVILMWDVHASQDTEVARQLQFAQQLSKPIHPVLLDTTRLPDTLVSSNPLTPVSSQPPFLNIVALLAPYLPASDSTDPLITLSEEMAHDHMRMRRQGIDRAAELLKAGIQRERVLALLDYIAHNDLTMTLREKAQGVLNEDAQGLPLSPPHPQDSRYSFQARCKSGHVSWFDKRKACVDSGPVYRGKEQELTELQVPCQYPGCGLQITVRVDCEGYR